MIYSLDIKRSEHPCSICAKRKVKCDRLIPCTYCSKRGQEKECIESYSKQESISRHNQSLSQILQFWQKYEYWVMDVGLFKTQRADAADQFVDMGDELKDCDRWVQILTREQSSKLLDYSMERLGSLYFGCLSDIGELYVVLEEYWERKDLARENINGDSLFSSDEYYSDALIWSIFTLALYYMPLKKLMTLFPSVPNELVSQHSAGFDNSMFCEEIRIEMVQCFTKCTLTLLEKARFMSNPDIRLIQVYLVLTNTTFPQRNIHLSKNLSIQCYNVAKFFRVNEFRPSVNDGTALRLTKVTCEKLWYRLCVCDYLQSNPTSYTPFHKELPSLLQHAAYLEDLPNIDIYQSEPNFEVFYWKVISLERDLDQYLNKESKPPLKTLNAIERQINIFNEKLSAEEDDESLKSDFEKFLVTYLLRTISWKLQKMYFIYHGVSGAFQKTMHYAKSLIALTVKNIKQQNNAIFASHFSVFQSLTRIASFYAFYGIFEESPEVEDLNLDIAELLSSLPSVFAVELVYSQYLLSRFESLKDIWSNIHLIDSNDYFRHPAIIILQRDIEKISEQYQQWPSLIKGSIASKGRKRNSRGEETNGIESSDLNLVVSTFESQYPITKIIK